MYSQAVERLLTVVETNQFARRSAKHWSSGELMNLQLTSLGTRKPGMWLQIRAVVPKVRWMSQDRGKRGGARIVYFYHSSEMPLVLT